MLPEHHHAGRLWIDERLMAAATAQGLPIPELEWLDTATDIGVPAQTLSITIGARSRRLTLSDADLELLPRTAAVQERVADELAAMLDAFARHGA